MKIFKKKDLNLLLNCELLKHKIDEKYYGSLACEHNEYYILNQLKEHFGYNYEEDPETQDYCLKATPEEIWKYYLSNVIPKLLN